MPLWMYYFISFDLSIKHLLFRFTFVYINKKHDGFSFGTVYLCFYDINKTLLVECKFSILSYAWKCMGKVFDYTVNNIYL